jgi:hypothetical protein
MIVLTILFSTQNPEVGVPFKKARETMRQKYYFC